MCICIYIYIYIHMYMYMYVRAYIGGGVQIKTERLSKRSKPVRLTKLRNKKLGPASVWGPEDRSGIETRNELGVRALASGCTGCVWLCLQAQEGNIYFTELAERVEYGNYAGPRAEDGVLPGVDLLVERGAAVTLASAALRVAVLHIVTCH